MHDDDGRKWFLCNAAHDAIDAFAGQEWHPARGLIGDPVNIHAGSDLGMTEAPDLFKRNGWYFLTVAESGTGNDHAVTLAQARFAPEWPLQRMGRERYLETPDGQAFHRLLYGRPLPGRVCTLGTGLAARVWTDDWLYLADGGIAPSMKLALDVARLPNGTGLASVGAGKSGVLV